MSGSVVIDAGLAVKWLVDEDDSDKAHAALQSPDARDAARIALHLMPFEVANALHRRVLRDELNVGDSTRMIARPLESRLELLQPPGLHVGALQLAYRLSQSAAHDRRCAPADADSPPPTHGPARLTRTWTRPPPPTLR